MTKLTLIKTLETRLFIFFLIVNIACQWNFVISLSKTFDRLQKETKKNEIFSSFLNSNYTFDFKSTTSL